MSTERDRVRQLVAALPGAAVRTAGDDLAFDTSWEIRAFALAVAAHQQGVYDWPEFQQALVASIADGDDRRWSYYEHWVEALEAVLGAGGVLGHDELDERARVVLATPRDLEHQRAKREPVAIDPATEGTGADRTHL